MIMIMAPYRICVLILTTSLMQTLLLAQIPGEQCFSKFTEGKDDFVLDTDESVKHGAEFLGSPTQVTRAKECVSECCKDPNCNLALMEKGDEEGTIKSCFLLNCLYKQKDVCSFVRKTGFSNYILTSYFKIYLEKYDKNRLPRASAGQDRVVQPRESVVLSGFESKGHEIEYLWEQVSGGQTAVLEKTNFKDEVKVSGLSAGVYKFKLTVTDHAGQSDSAVVTLLVLTPEQSHHHCLVPKKVGPCRGSFLRWHYNALTEKCENFTFGGCNPNRNNYLSKNECTQACDQVSVAPTPGRHGPIYPSHEECGSPCGSEKFPCANGCCIDKGLKCDQVKQCSDGSDEEQCDNLDKKFRLLLDLSEKDKDQDKAPSHCTQPPLTGPCRDSNTMWYYNPYERKCRRFNYGGCDGNKNKFDTEEKCMTLCSKITERDAYNNPGNFEQQKQDTQSVSIAIAVALGLAILILMAVIGYCLLKDRKKKQQSRHQHVSANGTHLLHVDDTEKLVYNSTIKPI
ncbi:kunitz-type protease inhibitor 1a [Hemibagrus wyckioides]|nr:kunitz-type protease inhibitor 1a [Hemibagrus wyckioides]